MSMEGKIKDALEGRITPEELTDEERVGFYKVVKEESQTELKKLTAFRTAKREEEARVKEYQEKVSAADAKLKEAEESLKNLEAQVDTTKQQVTQFRTEQVTKSKEKFFAEFKITDEAKKKEIEEKFAKLDSGKVDPDLIYKDLVSSYAAVDPENYLTTIKQAEELKKNADKHNQSQAGSHSSAPSGSEPPQFSKDVTDYAQEAGITPEQADKILKQGMRRTY